MFVFNKYTGGNHFEPTWLDGDNDNDDDNEAAAHSSDNIMDINVRRVVQGERLEIEHTRERDEESKRSGGEMGKRKAKRQSRRNSLGEKKESNRQKAIRRKSNF